MKIGKKNNTEWRKLKYFSSSFLNKFIARGSALAAPLLACFISVHMSNLMVSTVLSRRNFILNFMITKNFRNPHKILMNQLETKNGNQVSTELIEIIQP